MEITTAFEGQRVPLPFDEVQDSAPPDVRHYEVVADTIIPHLVFGNPAIEDGEGLRRLAVDEPVLLSPGGGWEGRLQMWYFDE